MAPRDSVSEPVPTGLQTLELGQETAASHGAPQYCRERPMASLSGTAYGFDSDGLPPGQ